ncbi:MAG: hypothetical protein HYY52_08110 [Candidatus Melainabacteria bacterium]|nr:hypothetical protein [Candidatus Melainabacteria bacterium]
MEYKNLILPLLLIQALLFNNYAYGKFKSNTDKNYLLTDLTHINITKSSLKKKNYIKKLIHEKRPKAVYLEQWLLFEPENKNLLKKLRKVTKKTNTKFYLVIGKNFWFGRRAVDNAIEAYNLYEKYIDGIVLRVEPNKSNVWKEDASIKTQILNLMLDGYSVIYKEAKKRNKSFIAEFPFWFSDFKGPFKIFSEDVCSYADKIVFLIDKPERIDDLDKEKIEWNKITCPYNINLTKRATSQDEDTLKDTYEKLNKKLTFYSNFNGYLIDADSDFTSDDL